MSFELLPMVIGVILEMGKEAAKAKIDRSETINRLYKHLNITCEPTNEFDSVYIHTLIEYGVFKPEPILNFFRNRSVREAFRQAFYTNDPANLG